MHESFRQKKRVPGFGIHTEIRHPEKTGTAYSNRRLYAGAAFVRLS